MKRRALNARALSSLFRDAREEIHAAMSLALHRINRCRRQLQMYQIAHADARGAAEKSAMIYRVKQCEGALKLYELERERVAQRLQWLESGIAACRSGGILAEEREVAPCQ
jgi:hypothetical protein